MPQVFCLAADPLDSWHVRTSGTGANLNAVAYGAGRFVAVGNSGAIVVSEDGTNWAFSVSGLTTNLHGVTWGTNRFVAVGDGGTILASSNAVDWIQQVSPTAERLKAVNWLNGRFLAVGGASTILDSTDGKSWTSQNSGAGYGYESLAYGAGIFCIGADSTSHIGLVSTSPDAITWSHHTNNSFHTFYDMAFGNGRFVAMSIRGRTQVSTDGASWATKQAGDADYLFGITFAQGIFVAVGGPYSSGKQKIATSLDGLNWSQRAVNTSFSPSLRSVVYGNGSFVAVGGKGLILQSDPYWTLRAPETPAPGAPIEWTFSGEVDRQYRLQYIAPAGGLTWMDLFEFTATNDVVTLLDPTAGESPAKWYRVVSP